MKKSILESVKKVTQIRLEQGTSDAETLLKEMKNNPFIEAEEISDGELEYEIKKFIRGFQSECAKGTTLIGEGDFDKYWLKNSKVDFKSKDSYLYSYIDHLRQVGFGDGSENIRNRIELASKEIVANFGNPKELGKWDRRGLLIGSVQSGKTANYTGVIHAATDIGYRIIFLISGTSNLLRKQTQERIEEMYVGRCSKENTPPYKRTIGIGETSDKYKEKDVMPKNHTTCDSDFTSRNSADANDITLMKSPQIFIVKKNKTVLESLIKFIEIYQNISDLPALIIDDEADLASINTNSNDRAADDKGELDPTTTNRLIRKLLTCFNRKTFLAVTATPFANIFINPEAYGDEELERDLFPKDFIHALRPPNNYIGGARIFDIDDDLEIIESEDEERFANDANNGKYIKIINDLVPHLADEITWANGKCKVKPKKKGDVVDSIPPSMKHAVCTFLIAKAIRLLRNDKNSHASMMINVTVKTNLIEDVKDQVILYMKKLDVEISNYASLSPSDAEKNSSTIKYLKKVFLDSYPNINKKNPNERCQFSWDEIQTQLYDAVTKIEVKSSWGNSSDVIDFDENEGCSKTYIIVGGFTLSRGYTIPGLTVSYLYRTSTAMDTLYQMGRWFGYHDGYEDLIKLYMEDVVNEYFENTIRATENLMDQIREMGRANKTPKNFGLYVKKYSKNLHISSKKKLGKAEENTVFNDCSGSLQSLRHFFRDEKENKNNLELTEKFIENNLKEYEIKRKNCYYFKNIENEKILEYLKEFNVVNNNQKQLRNAYIQEVYIKRKKIDFDVLIYNIGEEKVGKTEFVNQRRNIDPDRYWEVKEDHIVTSKSNVLETQLRFFFPDMQCESQKDFTELMKDFIEKNDGEKLSKMPFLYRDRPLLILGKHDFYMKSNDELLIKDVINYGIIYPSPGPGIYEVQLNNAQKIKEQGELFI